MEEEIKEAVGLSSPQVQPEPTPPPEPDIYSLGKILAANEPEPTKK